MNNTATKIRPLYLVGAHFPGCLHDYQELHSNQRDARSAAYHYARDFADQHNGHWWKASDNLYVIDYGTNNHNQYLVSIDAIDWREWANDMGVTTRQEVLEQSDLW
jgi:hypothetical protein